MPTSEERIQKFRLAQQLIDAKLKSLAKELQTISDYAPLVPKSWVDYFKKQAKLEASRFDVPDERGKSGLNYERLGTLICLQLEKLKQEHTKHFSPAEVKRDIAEDVGCSGPTVERAIDMVSSLLSGSAFDSEELTSQHKELLEGICEALPQLRDRQIAKVDHTEKELKRLAETINEADANVRLYLDKLKKRPSSGNN